MRQVILAISASLLSHAMSAQLLVNEVQIAYLLSIAHKDGTDKDFRPKRFVKR